MLMRMDTFKLRHKFCQNWDVKRRSRSDKIECGTPNLLTILTTNALASAGAVVSFFKGVNTQYLLNRSTTLSILQYPSGVQGRSVIKSMLMCSQGQVGDARGINNPYGLALAGLCT